MSDDSAIPQLPVATPIVAQPVRFCSRCGTSLNLETGGCPRCNPAATPSVAQDVLSGGAEGNSTAAAVATVARPPRDEIAAVKDAVGLYFALLAVSLLLMIYLLATGAEGRHAIEAEFVASGGITIVALIYALRWRNEIGAALQRVGSPIYYVAAVGLGGCSFVVAATAVGLLERLFKVPSLGYLSEYEAAGYGFGVAVLSVAVQPAIFEELAFRGVIFGAMRRVISPWESIVVVALMFGILHLSIPSLLHLTLLGFILGWLRHRSGSLYPCVLMHFTHNLLVLLDERYRWFS